MPDLCATSQFWKTRESRKKRGGAEWDWSLKVPKKRVKGVRINPNDARGEIQRQKSGNSIIIYRS